MRKQAVTKTLKLGDVTVRVSKAKKKYTIFIDAPADAYLSMRSRGGKREEGAAPYNAPEALLHSLAERGIGVWIKERTA